MRILALVTDPIGGHGGISAFSNFFFQALSEHPKVQKIVIQSLTAPGPNPILPPKVIQNPASNSKIKFVIDAFRAALDQGPYDLILCGHLHLIFVSYLISLFLRKPIVCLGYGKEIWKKPRWELDFAFHQSHSFWVISRYTAERMRAWCRMPAYRFRILPPTFDEAYVHGEASIPTHFYEKHPALIGKKILLTVSRIQKTERYKGHDRIIRILPELIKKHPNLVYVIAGGGNDVATLQTLVDQSGLADHVVFLGKITDTELREVYAVSHLFVMHSTEEGFGIVFLEAMASGVPAIGGNVDGSVDALQDGRLGEPVSEKGLLEAIDRHLKTSHDPRKLSETTHQIFGYNNFKRHLHELVNEFARSISL